MAFVIVGGGHAGGQAAASLRQAGYAGAIIIVGEEPHVPYQRPPLSKQYLAGEQGLDRVILRPEAFYRDKRIELRRGVRAVGLDAGARALELEDGAVLRYDKLLLATGARARRLDVPGADLAGIFLLRTIADVDRIRAELAPGKRLVIVGGGYIGLEAAAVATVAGLNVTVLELAPRILQRVATPQLSDFYGALHADAGVAIRTGVAVAGFDGERGRLAAVRCADGATAPADLAIVGAGVVPNVELAANAGLRCDDGIVVDERCATSAADVYAAGDCTNHPNPLLGRRLRLESVPNAMEQARVAAANMAGGGKTYASVPWFWSDQYDLKLQMAGFAADGDSSVMRGDPASRRFTAFHLKGDVLVAVDAVNAPREFMACRQLIGRQLDPARLADPLVDLKTLL